MNAAVLATVGDVAAATHHRGVVLVRVDGISDEKKGRIVARAIREHDAEFPGAFTVIQHGTIRIRRA